MSITAGRNPPESTEPKGLVMFLPGSISGVQVGGCAVTSCKRCIILVGNISQFWDVLSETSLIEGRADATDIIFTLHFSSFYIYIYVYIYIYIYVCIYIYVYVYIYNMYIYIYIYICIKSVNCWVHVHEFLQCLMDTPSRGMSASNGWRVWVVLSWKAGLESLVPLCPTMMFIYYIY